MDVTKGAAIAAAVAAVIATMACSSDRDDGTSSAAAKQDALVKCEGINECKGTSECKGSDGESACQGLNECKGQGWITVPTEECSQKGGKVIGGAESATNAPPPPAPGTDAAVTAKSVKCGGINECKGQGACKGAGNECKGQNECKGHGFIEVPSEADCSAKGGEVIG